MTARQTVNPASQAMVFDLLASIEQPGGGKVLAARLAAGHSQAQAATLSGLGNKARWSEYELGVRNIELTRWAVYLLATGHHPAFALAPIAQRQTAAA